MSWMLILQLILLIAWLGLIVNSVVNNIIKTYWTEQTKFYDHHEDLVHDRQEKPKPHTTYEGV